MTARRDEQSWSRCGMQHPEMQTWERKVWGAARKNLKAIPGGPDVKTVLPVQGLWVQSLVRKLRSHTCRGHKKKMKAGRPS